MSDSNIHNNPGDSNQGGQNTQDSSRYEETRQFLNALDPDGQFTFQTFTGDKDSVRGDDPLRRVRHGTFDQHGDELIELNEQGAAVTVVVNGGERVRAVFADLDGAPIGPVIEMPDDEKPHIIVQSSNDRFHAYWLCDDVPVASFSDIQRRIIHKFMSDPQVHDLKRCMRLPGFQHNKKGSKFTSFLWRLDVDRPRFTFDQLMSIFPEVTASAASSQRSWQDNYKVTGDVDEAGAVRLLEDCFPEKGGTNEAYMALTGCLARIEAANPEREDYPAISDRIVDHLIGLRRGQEEDRHLLAGARKKLSQGKHKRVSGWRKLGKVLGADNAMSLRTLLGVIAAGSKGPSPLASAPFADKIVWEPGSSPPQPDNIEHNVTAILRYDEAFSDDDGRPAIFYDVRTRHLMIECDIWAELNGSPDLTGHGYPRRVMNHDHVEIKTYCQRRWGLKVSLDTVRNAVDVYGKAVPRNVLRERLEALDRDESCNHLATVFDDCVVCVKPDDMTDDDWIKYKYACAKMIFVAAVARTFEPGCRADNMVILEGEQGLTKTAWCKAVAFGDPHKSDTCPYFTTYTGDLSKPTKDDTAKMIGRMILEFSELATMKKTQDVEDLKTFMSNGTLTLRKAYRRDEIDYDRTDVCIGTINPDANGYLRDTTGGRRFWPLKVERIDMDLFLARRDQIFAEAVYEYLHGAEQAKWWPSDDEMRIGVVQQQARFQAGEFADHLADLIGDREGVILRENLYDVLDINLSDRRSQAGAEIDKSMKALGFEKVRAYIALPGRSSKARKTFYRKGDSQEIITLTTAGTGTPENDNLSGALPF